MPTIRPVVVAAILTLVGGNAALAQSEPVPPPPAEAAPAPSPALSIDTPIETLVAAPAAKAALDADIPGLTTHPAYDKFKRESLRTLAPKFGGAITDKDLAKVQADLAALPQSLASR
ncbi:hypothetical protein [Caulobacter segnis]|jgi:hypothetical protein|uniref:hypothetical protein n=1 Tax=Caulobacter segnis TaxID=88688 RepID=UPI001CBE7E9A|nr:hypothetical protein [Caulobacter segnis]UAL09358.1 hypothetical protein K8940_16410 [Caulobacter segnis]